MLTYEFSNRNTQNTFKQVISMFPQLFALKSTYQNKLRFLFTIINEKITHIHELIE